MGFLGSMDLLNYFDMKRCKTLFFRLRAKLKKSLKNNGAFHSKNKQLRFQYDPSSYALNFDDGSCYFSDNNNSSFHGDATCKKMKDKILIRDDGGDDDKAVLGFYTDVNNVTWVYVIWGPILGHYKS